MPRWTLDKELEDTSEATASGYSLGKRAERSEEKSSDKEGIKSTPSTAAEADAVTVDKGIYKRGGYVGARASGKRMYAKGGMVKGKC